MNNEEKGTSMAETNWVAQIGKELERIFRYLLPGITIVGLARLSHPSWFCWAHLDNPQHLVFLAAIALSVGSSWYVTHRYSVHQVLDFAFDCCREHRLRGYVTWLAEHVANSLRGKEKDAALRRHSGLRSAQIIFMFITGEAALLFALVSPEECSFVFRYKCHIGVLAGAILLAALWQQWIGYKIDLYAVNNPQQS